MQSQLLPVQEQTGISSYSSPPPSCRPSETGSPSSTFSNSSDGHNEHYSKDHVGKATYFTTGQFSGMTIRMELQEIQKADLGRK